MAQEPDSLAFRFAVVLALALIVLILATWAARPILGTIRLRRSRIATRFTGLSI
jgi:F0F1-type ATP synthase membrane subunit b/b'